MHGLQSPTLQPNDDGTYGSVARRFAHADDVGVTEGVGVWLGVRAADGVLLGVFDGDGVLLGVPLGVRDGDGVPVTVDVCVGRGVAVDHANSMLPPPGLSW